MKMPFSKSRDPFAALQSDLDVKVARQARFASKLADAVTVQETADRVRRDALLSETDTDAAAFDGMNRKCLAAEDQRRAIESAMRHGADEVEEARQRLAQARDTADRDVAALNLRTRADRLDAAALKLDAAVRAFVDEKATFRAVLAECGAGDSSTIDAVLSASPGSVGIGVSLKAVLEEAGRVMLPEIRPGGVLAPKTIYPASGAPAPPPDLTGLVQRSQSARLRAEADRILAGEGSSPSMIPIGARTPPDPNNPINQDRATIRVVLREAIRYGSVDAQGRELWAEIGSNELPARVAEIATEMGLTVPVESAEGRAIVERTIRFANAPRRTTPEEKGVVPRHYIDVDHGTIAAAERSVIWAEPEGRRA